MDGLFANLLHKTIKFNNIENLKIELLKIINTIIDKHSWVQRKAARILKVNQSDISNIECLKASGFALGRIFLFLLRLNYDIKLAVDSNLLKSIVTIQPSMEEVKIELMFIITDAVEKNKWPQWKVGQILKVSQAKISYIKTLKAFEFSVDHLISFLILLGCNIEVTVEEKKLPIFPHDF